MSWRNADLLWLLLTVPAVVALLLWAWRTRARAQQRMGPPTAVDRLITHRPKGWRTARTVLTLFALTFAVITLAGPRYGTHTRTFRKRGVDVVVALDFSKSMLARDVNPSRIDRAKAELVRFVNDLDGDRVGIVAFAGDTIEFPMTSDYSAVELFLRDLTPNDMPLGGTAIGRALTASQRLLNRTDPDASDAERNQLYTRVVVLFTDGEDHEGQPETVVKQYADAGITLFTVGIGSRSGEPIPTYTDNGQWIGYLRDDDDKVITTSLTADNERKLRSYAEATGGEYFRAKKGDVGVETIRKRIRRMRQQERKAKRVQVHEERYAWVALPVLLLLLLEYLLPLGQGRPKERNTHDTH